MPVTGLRGRQIKDEDVFREDLNISQSGSAVIRKIIAGTGISISSTGVDAGTGDVTINVTGGGGSIDGSGTATYLPKWTGSTTLGNSAIFEGTGFTDIRGFRFYEYANRPDTFSGDVFFVADYPNPVAGKMFIGDGSGWRFHFSRRSAGGYLTITQVGAISGTGTSISLTGLGLQQGDVVIVASYNDGAQPATPSTYTAGQQGFTNSVGYQWSYKVMGATPDTSVTGLTAGISYVVAFRNVDIANILDVTPPTVTTNASVGMPDCPAINIVTPTAMVVAIGFLDDDVVASTTTAPSNLSTGFVAAQYGSAGSGGTIMLAWGVEEETGNFDPAAFGGTGSDGWIGSTIALRPIFSESAPLTTDVFSFRDSGQLRMSQYTSPTSFTGTPVGYLAFNDMGEVISVDVPTGGGGSVGGSGTTNFIPIWTSANALGDSVLSFSDVTGKFTSQADLVITAANDTGNGGGQIYLNGATGNRIDFNTNGVAAPTTTTRSVGTKLVLFPQLSASTTDYAIGIEGSTLWFSTPTTGSTYKWYGATTAQMVLAGGNLGINVVSPAGRLHLFGGSLAASGGNDFIVSSGLTTGRLSTYDAGSVVALHSWLDNTTYEISSGSSSGWVSGITITGNNATLHKGSVKIWTVSATRLEVSNTGQLKLNQYTTTSSFSGTAVGVLAFDSSGNILTIPTPGGGSGLTGSGTTNYVPKFTGSTSVGNSSIFDNGTNVGIGTATPTNITNYRTLHIQGGTSGAVLYFSDSTGTGRGYVYGSSAETAINCPNQFRVYVAGSTKISATTSGVGIGGALSNGYDLFVQGTGATLLELSSTSANGGYLAFTRSSTTYFGYVGNSAQLFGAGYNGNTELGLRSEGAINFGTSGGVAIARIQSTGQLKLPSYTTPSSFTGTAVGILAFDSTGNIITSAVPSGGGEVTTMYRISFAAEVANTWSNMPSTLQFFDSSSAFVTQADLSTFNEVRLIVNKQGTAGATNSRLYLRYQQTSGSVFTQASYSDIGTSEVSVAVNTTNNVLTTSWIPLAGNAMSDVWVALLGDGGDGAADPVFGNIYAEFRYNPSLNAQN